MTASAAWKLRFEDGSGVDATAAALRFKDIFKQCHNWDLYRSAFDYRKRELEAMGAIRREFEIVQAVQVGAGEQLAIGASALQLQSAFGAAVLPGPGLKGMCLEVATELLASEEDQGRGELEQIFGAMAAQGRWTFEDAWWVPGSAGPFVIEGDTPEEKVWHDSKGQTPVLLKSKPEPAPRLAAVGHFAFWLDISRHVSEDLDRQTLEAGAWKLLERALCTHGQGARRNIDDYGRFKPVAASPA